MAILRTYETFSPITLQDYLYDERYIEMRMLAPDQGDGIQIKRREDNSFTGIGKVCISPKQSIRIKGFVQSHFEGIRAQIHMPQETWYGVNVVVNGIPLYHNGTTWKRSRTKTQNNSMLEIINNIESLNDLSNGMPFDFNWVLWMESLNDISTPVFQSLELSYGFADNSVPSNEPHLCKIYFDAVQIGGEHGTRKLAIRLKNNNVYYNESVLIEDIQKYVSPDRDGRYSVELIETSGMNLHEGVEQTYELIIDTNNKIEFTVPRLSEANLFGYVV